MGYARYVGRVGALAVALGIGVALANGPATAWADGDEGSSSGSASSTSDSSSSADSKSDTSGSAGSTGASSDGAAGNASPGADGGTGDAAGEDADDDGSTDAAKENDESGADDAAAGDDSTSDPGQPAGVRKGSRGSQRESVTPRSEVNLRSEAVPSAKRSPAATTVSNTPTTGAGGTAPQAVSVSETRRSVPISTPLRSADVVDVAAVSTATREPAKTVTTALLSALGLSPLATGGPADAPDSPVAWAMFAALRRQTDEDAGTEQKLLSVADPVAGTMSVDGADEPMMMMAAAVASAPVVGSPDQVSGAVLVGLNPVGPSGNPLTYTVTSQPVNGTVTVVGASATYTPTVAARLATGSTAGVDFDSFAVSDGQTSTSVSVPVLPAVWANQASSSNVTGASPSGVALVGDLAYVANQGTNTVTVINTKTGAVVGSPIVVGSAPTGVLASADGSKVFVTNRTSGTVSVIRTLDNTLTEPITVGTSPEQMALNSTGTKLYVTNYGSSNVSVVDVSGQTPSLDIAVGANPRGIAYATVNGQPRVYVTRYNSSSVAVIDANTNMQIDINPKTKAIDSITVGANPQAIVISPDGTRAYVTNFGSSSVSVINTATNSLDGAAISVGSNSKPVGISLSKDKDGSLLYVANSNDTVSVINTKTRATVATLQIDTAPEVNNHFLTVRSDGSLVVTDTADKTVRVVALNRGNTAPVAIANPSVGDADPATGAISGPVNIRDWDGDPLSYSAIVAPTKGSLTFNPAIGTYTYTPTQAARDAAAQNPGLTDTFTIRATDHPYAAFATTVDVTVAISPTPSTPPLTGKTTPITVGGYPTGVAVAGDRIYVANTGGNSISVIDATDNTVIKTIPNVAQPFKLAASPDGTRVYVADTSGRPGSINTVSVVDTSTDTVTATITVPDLDGINYGADLIVSPDGRRVYVVPQYDQTVSVIDTDPTSANYKVIATANVGYRGVGDVKITPDGTRLYMSADAFGRIRVINTGNLAVVDTIEISEGGPGSIAFNPDGTRAFVVSTVVTEGYMVYNSLAVIDIDPTSSTYNTQVATIGGWETDYVPSWEDVALSPDGSRAYVTETDGKTVTVIDTATLNEIGTFTTDEFGGEFEIRNIAVARDGTLYVTDASEGKVYASTLDGAQAQALTAEFGSRQSEFTMMLASAEFAGGESMLMAAAVNSAPSASPTVGLPETVNGKVTGSLNAVDSDGNPLTYTVQSQSIGTEVTINGAGSFTYTPSVTQRLQAATTTGLDTDTFTVRVSDGQTFTDVPVTVVVRPGQLAGGTPVDVDRDPSAVAVNANGSLAYVTNQYDKSVSVIDTSTGAVVATIKVPYSPTAVVVSPVASQNRAYVAMTTGVAVIDTANNKVVDLNTGTATIDVIKVGSSPSAIAINPAGTRLYVSNGGSITVSVINTATNLEITKVTVGSQPSGLAVSPDGTRLYALNRYNDRVTVIRTADNVVIGTATVGDSPRNVVVSPDGQRTYVSNYTSGTVTVLNTVETTPAFVKTITVGTQPEGIAISKDGALVYVANGRDTVSVIDTRSNTVIGSPVSIDSPAESGAHAIAVSGNKIYVTDYVDDFVRVLDMARVQTAPQANGAPTVDPPNPNTGTIVGDLKVIDTDGDALSYTVSDAPDQGALTVNPNGTYTYTPTAAARAAAGANTVDTFTVRVSDSLDASKDVSVTVPISPAPLPPNRAPYANATGWGTEGDLATGLITGNMNGVDPDGDPLTYAVWSPSRSGTVTVNPTTGEFTYIPTLVARLKADTTAGTDYDAISISVSDGRATTNYSMPVYVAPARAGVASPIAVGQDPTGVAVSGNQVFVLNQTDKTMSVIGPTSSSTIPFTSTPTAVAVSPDGSRAYVALSGTTGSLAVIDTASKQIVTNVTVGSSPAGVAVSQDGRGVYVTNSGSGNVSVIDTDPTSATYNTELRRITAGTQPTGIAVAPDGRRLYVTRPGSGSVAVVDTVTNTVAANVAVGGAPRGVAITPDGRHAYVTNDDGTVSVIDTVDNFVVNRIAVGPSPLGVAIGRDGTAFVANGDDTVSLIDTGKQSVFATFALSPQTATGSHYVAVNADATRIYVTDTRDAALRGLAITRGNTAPAINPYVPVVLGTPNTTSGAVTGSVNATDPEVDRLTYTASAPANGIVTIDAATGNFTYTPSQTARDFALTTEQNDIDTFTITVSDRQATANTIVSVPVMATNNVAPEWQNQTINYDPVTRTTTGTVIARDADGDTLRYYLIGSSYAGSATVTANGSYVYTPFYTGPNGYWNYDYIPVAITDGHYTTYAWIYVDTYTEYCGEACAL